MNTATYEKAASKPEIINSLKKVLVGEDRGFRCGNLQIEDTPAGIVVSRGLLIRITDLLDE